MKGANRRTSCKKLFKKLEILTVPTQYIYIYIYICITEFFNWKSGKISD